MPMNELFTLLNYQNDAELEAAIWLNIFEEIPDSAFTDSSDQPSQLTIYALEQYARAYVNLGDENVILN